MNDKMLKLYVSAQTRAIGFKNSLSKHIRSEDDGSFLTENLGVVAITVALIALVLVGFTAIIGNSNGTSGDGVLGTLTTRITDFFSGTSGI